MVYIRRMNFAVLQQSTVSYSISEKTRTAFAEEFITDTPDDYYVEPGPDKDQITLSNFSKGLPRHFVLPASLCSKNHRHREARRAVAIQ